MKQIISRIPVPVRWFVVGYGAATLVNFLLERATGS